jgi:hypothetical protein
MRVFYNVLYFAPLFCYRLGILFVETKESGVQYILLHSSVICFFTDLVTLKAEIFYSAFLYLLHICT